MNIAEEWRMYEPNDPRTHPEEIARVEVEFPDGTKVVGQYSRDTGMFTFVGYSDIHSKLTESTITRWRYIDIFR